MNEQVNDCCKAIIFEARKMRQNREISVLDMFRLKLMTRPMFHDKFHELSEALLEEAQEEAPDIFSSPGEDQPYGAIDWEKLGEFIQKIMPVILEFVMALLRGI